MPALPPERCAGRHGPVRLPARDTCGSASLRVVCTFPNACVFLQYLSVCLLHNTSFVAEVDTTKQSNNKHNYTPTPKPKSNIALAFTPTTTMTSAPPSKITVVVPKLSAIHSATVSAPTNIACIKYWGKANSHYNTPINDSLSVSLDQCDLRAVTTASASSSFDRDRLWLNGSEVLDVSTSKRFRACVDGVRALATDKIDPATNQVLVAKSDWADMHVYIASYNTFPTAAGLASSAAGLSLFIAQLPIVVGPGKGQQIAPVVSRQ